VNVPEGEIEVKGRLMSPDMGQCQVEMPRPFCLVIFGASGDLTSRKIIPGVYRLFHYGFLPESFFVMGVARTDMDDNAYRQSMQGAVKEALPDDYSQDVWDKFAERLCYCKIDYAESGTYKAIKEKLEPSEKKYSTGGNRIFYLAIPPDVYETVILNLGESGLSREKDGYSHVVIEKPFGRDTESARSLNGALRKSFEERQIYRMDHYLAKETVQDILIFRFANSIFEPLWNRRYIDHVQITVAETLGVGHRAGYYERAGVLRDMFQNHLFQLIALTAMEPPSVFEADRVRDEKVKVFRSIRPFPLKALGECVALGQYGSGTISGEEVIGYRGEPGVSPASKTPTSAALKVFIDNWRWNGVPFYVRSGKRMAKRKASISIHYKQVPHLMFKGIMEENIEPSTLVMRLQPDEGINLEFQTKTPGAKLCLNRVLMDFSYQKVFTFEAYERVLLDCMQGDQMLFVRGDGVDATWQILTPLIEELEATKGGLDFPNYAAGSEGPDNAAKLIEADGRKWRPL
jgi:glucose-6-phosphate 1-dehydrogenase